MNDVYHALANFLLTGGAAVLCILSFVLLATRRSAWAALCLILAVAAIVLSLAT